MLKIVVARKRNKLEVNFKYTGERVIAFRTKKKKRQDDDFQLKSPHNTKHKNMKQEESLTDNF